MPSVLLGQIIQDKTYVSLYAKMIQDWYSQWLFNASSSVQNNKFEKMRPFLALADLQ